MSTNITYASVHSVLDLSVTDIPEDDTEDLIDLAIDLLNLLGNASIPNLGGVTPAKFVLLDSRQRGAVLLVVRMLYHSFYKSIGASSISSLSVNPIDVLANPSMMKLIQTAASRLLPRDFKRI